MGGGGGGGAVTAVEAEVVVGQLEVSTISASDLFAWSSPLLSSSSASTASTMAVVTHCLAVTTNPLQRALDQVLKYQDKDE